MIITWLSVIILAYFFFSLSSLGNKLILAGPPKPNSYIFFVGLSNILVLIFLPFINFSIPGVSILLLMMVEAVVFMGGLYAMYWAIEKYDVTKVVTTIGATQPIFIFILGWLVWNQSIVSKTNIFAFVLLLLGSILISVGKNREATRGYLKPTIIASFLFALDYIFSKFIFLSEPFLLGLIWMRMFAFIIALLFLLSKKNRKDIFKKRNILNKKTGIIFAFTNASGGTAGILQSYAIALAPVAFLPIVNSLNGLQYVFLFFMTLFLTLLWPKLLREEISKKIIFQKIISIILIGSGLALLVL